MTTPKPRRFGALLRDVLSFQLKLMCDAAIDIALIPLALGSGLLDLVMLRKQDPRYFRAVLDLAQRAEEWMDRWRRVIYSRYGSHPEQFDGLLHRLETMLRDPKHGGREARVLRRWLEMQWSRRRRTHHPNAPGVDHD